MPNWFKKIFGLDQPEISVDKLPNDPQLQQALANHVLRGIIKEQQSNRRWTIVKRIMMASFLIVGLIFYVVFEAKFLGLKFSPKSATVGVIRIEGNILNTSLASAEKILPALKKAFENDSTEAIILAIDSQGGSPVEADRIGMAIDDLKKKHNKPVYAVIQNVGASAAYMIALHADTVYASRYSLVGSVGAVLSAWDVHEAIETYKVRQKVFASGPLKAMLNPFTPSSPEADEKAQTLVNIMGHRFADELKTRRGDLLKPNFKYDTGEIWDGVGAKDIGLVDEIGTIESVAAKHPEAKLYDFGPGKQKSGIFSGSLGDWATENGTNLIKNVLHNTPTTELR